MAASVSPRWSASSPRATAAAAAGPGVPSPGEAPRCRGRVALRQQQAAAPRLAVVTERHGLRERLFGAGQVTATNPDVHQLAIAPRGADAVHRPQLLARPQYPFLRLGQLTVEAIDLPLVEATQPAVAGDRLALAVASRHVRPLCGASPVAEGPTDRDHRAVHVAGVNRCHPRPHGQRGRLIDEREHLSPVALGDRNVCKALHRHRLHAGADHPTSDRPRVRQRRPRTVDIARRQLGERQHPHRERVLGRLGLSLEELHTSEEAGGRHRLVEHQHVLARLLQDHARGRGSRAGRAKGDLGSLERVQEPHLVAHPPARPCQPLQVFGFERLVGVGIKEQRTGHNPVAATVGRPCFIEARRAV